MLRASELCGVVDDIRIEPAVPSDASGIEALLVHSNLPTDGLAVCLESTFVARSGGRIVGSVAIELHADGGLLRSVAVNAGCRGAGLGGRLTVAAIEEARRRQLPALYLLTMTAEGFFPRFGFETIPRDEVPASVQHSAEFRGACPATALAMVKRLPASR
jgi:amino-acid N-acetyltransferase